jgi:pimeloyl-ACP methyl ester carboxylesterase
MTTRVHNVELFSETLRLAVADQGLGGRHVFLLLHGGAGPASMSGLAGALSKDARVIAPTHPGFNGQPRPERFTRIDDLVMAYLSLIQQLNLSRVIIVGNSIGGWIAAEIALRKSPRISGIVLLNSVGIDPGSSERKIVDPANFAPEKRSALFFHDPKRFAVVPTPEALAATAENQRALRVYAGEPFMQDPSLRSRLRQISIPALVVWGESDRMVDTDYGRLFAASIPGARFEPIAEAGHFPHIEQMDAVVRLIGDFATALR